MKLFTLQKSLILMACLLLVAASRLLVVRQLNMNVDEIWSIWQTFGTPQQILQWTPYDWPPLYYLTLALWRVLVGMYPFMLRYLSVLSFLIGCAALYRVLHRLHDEAAALLVIPAYAALGYIGILGTEVRGYALLLGLMPVTFWLALRYFDHPDWRRGLALGLCLCAMFYISLSSVGAFFILGLYTLLVYRRAVWRWWLPGTAAAVLALPEIREKVNLVARPAATTSIKLPPLPEALLSLFQTFAGSTVVIWAGLLLLAVVLLIYRPRAINRVAVAFLMWAFGGALVLYIINPFLGFFSPRYAWWVMIGIALCTAYGLARLPGITRLAAGVLLIGMIFPAVPMPHLDDFAPSLGTNLEWLKDHIQPGDAIVVDPSTKCGPVEAWDYYTRLYFPNGLSIVNDPTGYRRIWYVTFDGRQDPTLLGEVSDNRIPDRFVGPPGCLFRLFQAPPDVKGIAFENGMRFHGMDVINSDGVIRSTPVALHEGETIHIRLWWSVDRPIDLDYSVGTYILRSDGNLLSQVNSSPILTYPKDAPAETSRWQPGQYYLEERDLTLPYPVARSSAGIYLAVYFWQDQRRLNAPGVDSNGLLLLRKLQIVAW
jgi:hypothetical protein